jgi:hypothetical protein
VSKSGIVSKGLAPVNRLQSSGQEYWGMDVHIQRSRERINLDEDETFGETCGTT